MTHAVTPATVTHRKDAERSRAAILSAGRELLAADDVPMYELARRAGVGQAMLYQHQRSGGRTAQGTAISSSWMKR